MQGRFVAVLTLVLTLIAGALGDAPASSTPPPRDLSLLEYQSELERIAGLLAPMQNDDAAVIALHDSIADAFRVTAGGRQFVIDNTKMKLAIGEYKIAKPARREE